MKKDLIPCHKCGKLFDVLELRLEICYHPICYLCAKCHDESKNVLERWLNEPRQLEFEFE